MSTAKLSAGAFLLALVLMLPFDWWFTRLLGLAALFVFVVAGVFAIADPALLEDGATEQIDELQATQGHRQGRS